MEIDRKKLLEAIGRVLPATARKEVFDQATKIIFTRGQIAAYNDEISIFERCDGLGDLEGAVDGKHLHALLNRVKADTVDLSLTESQLSFRAGRVRASFDLAPITLPVDEIDRSGSDGSPLEDNFVKSLRLIAGTCARDMSRPVLACVSMSGSTLEAADGYRAARIDLGGISIPSLLLPVTSAETLVAYPIERVAVSDSGEWARFTSHSGRTMIFARVLSGEFPDLSSLYRVEGVEVTLPKTLTESLERAKIFAEREHSIDETVQLELRPNQIQVSSSYEGGQFKEIIRSDQDVSAAFSIHPEFLSEVLKTGTRCIVGPKHIKFTGPSWQHVIALRD